MAFYGFETVQAGDYGVVKISDTGSGIPENEMKRILCENSFVCEK